MLTKSKALLLLLVIAIAGCGSSNESTPIVPEPVEPATSSESTVCTAGSVQVTACPVNVPNALVVNQTAICAADGSSYETTECTVEQCAGGFVLKNNACVAEPVCNAGETDTRVCTSAISNALFAEEVLMCRADGSGFDDGLCEVKQCEEGYNLEGNACVLAPVCEAGNVETLSCTTSIENAIFATQVSVCNADGFGFDIGPCELQQCAEGFVLENNKCVVPPIIVAEGLQLRGERPRILFTKEGLQDYLSKLSGEASLEPFSTIFDKMVTREDSLIDNPAKAGLMNLALIYLVQGDQVYLDAYMSGLNHHLTWLEGNTVRQFDPAGIVSMDLLWEYISENTKLRVLEQASARFSSVDTEGFSYHGAFTRNQLLLLAGLFIEDPILSNSAVTSQPDRFPFSPAEQLIYLQSQIEDPNGEFRQFERRIAGDMTYNTALEGEFGGMYDNFGYDVAEEAMSILLVRIYQNMFGKNVADEFLHDKYRGLFYQNMIQPDGNAPRIWRWVNSRVEGPNSLMAPIAADTYKDGRMQYYSNITVELFIDDDAEYIIEDAGFTMYFHDPELQPIAPSTNPTSRYFSGPGFVPMRASHTPESAYGLFMSGEGISRRFTDVNSFLLFKNEPAVVHAGGRFRFSEINERHRTLSQMSLSKNTIRVIDPMESLDNDAQGNRGNLYSGVQLANEYNFGGQIPETHVKSIDGATIRRNTMDGVENLYNSGDITRYEHVESEFTYTRGKGEFNYTKKINQFDREFVFIPPATFITFDRLDLANPQHQKVWNIHTVYEPVFLNGLADTSRKGLTTSNDGKTLLAVGELQQLQIENLLPENSVIEVRGGESFLAQDLELTPSQVIDESNIADLDTGRSVEFIVQGIDLEGTITVTGDTEEQNGVSEELRFFSDSYINVEFGQATGGSATEIQDTTKRWKTDEFKGARVLYNGGGARAVITGNNANTLFGDFPAGWQHWRYSIEKVLRSTESRFTNISSIATTDMSVSDLDLRVLHYFDSLAADGTLHSFAPQSDGKNDAYIGQKEFGRYTLNVISNNENTEDYFLNVMTLQDVGEDLQPTINVSNASAGALIVDDYLIVFSKDFQDNPSEVTIDIETNNISKILVIGLQQNGLYFLKSSDNIVSLVTSDNGGVPLNASDMGTISYNFE